MNKIKLCKIKPGQRATVVSVGEKCHIKQRLSDIGLIDGTEVDCLFKSPMGGMTAYLIRGSVFAIRDEDCADICVVGLQNGID